MRKLLFVSCIVFVSIAGCQPAPPEPATPPPSPTPSATPAPTLPEPVQPTDTPLPPSPTPKLIPDRAYPPLILADFEANPRTWLDRMDFLHDAGINTLIIHLAYHRDSGEEYRLVYPRDQEGNPSEEYVQELVVAARRAGFAVMLGPMVGRIGDPHVPIEAIDDWQRFKDDSIEIVVRWAAIAEDLQVEYFMPFCELNEVLFKQQDPADPDRPLYTSEDVFSLLKEWDEQALPRIREVFTGQLINQIYPVRGSLLQYAVTGYDILGLSVYPPDYDNVDEVRAWTRMVYQEAQEIARREGIDWMLVEGFMAPWTSGEDPQILDGVQADRWTLSGELYLEATTVPPIGYGTSLDFWTPEGLYSAEDTQSVEVLKGFFEDFSQAR